MTFSNASQRTRLAPLLLCAGTVMPVHCVAQWLPACFGYRGVPQPCTCTCSSHQTMYVEHSLFLTVSLHACPAWCCAPGRGVILEHWEPARGTHGTALVHVSQPACCSWWLCVLSRQLAVQAMVLQASPLLRVINTAFLIMIVYSKVVCQAEPTEGSTKAYNQGNENTAKHALQLLR